MKSTTSMPDTRPSASLTYRTRMIMSRAALLFVGGLTGQWAAVHTLAGTHEQWPRTLAMVWFVAMIFLQAMCVWVAWTAYRTNGRPKGRRAGERLGGFHDDGGAALRATAMARLRRQRPQRYVPQERA